MTPEQRRENDRRWLSSIERTRAVVGDDVEIVIVMSQKTYDDMVCDSGVHPIATEREIDVGYYGRFYGHRICVIQQEVDGDYYHPAILNYNHEFPQDIPVGTVILDPECNVLYKYNDHHAFMPIGYTVSFFREDEGESQENHEEADDAPDGDLPWYRNTATAAAPHSRPGDYSWADAIRDNRFAINTFEAGALFQNGTSWEWDCAMDLSVPEASIDHNVFVEAIKRYSASPRTDGKAKKKANMRLSKDDTKELDDFLGSFRVLENA